MGRAVWAGAHTAHFSKMFLTVPLYCKLNSALTFEWVKIYVGPGALAAETGARTRL